MQEIINAKAQRSKAAKRRAVIEYIIIFFLVGFAAAAALFVRANEFTQATAEAFIGAVLPAEAQQVQFATRAQPARVVWFRFSLPAGTDVSAWVKALGLDVTVRENFTPFPTPNYTEAEMAWWTPYTAQSYSGLYAIHANKVYELLVDQTDAAILTVYLRVYGL